MNDPAERIKEFREVNRQALAMLNPSHLKRGGLTQTYQEWLFDAAILLVRTLAPLDGLYVVSQNRNCHSPCRLKISHVEDNTCYIVMVVAYRPDHTIDDVLISFCIDAMYSGGLTYAARSSYPGEPWYVKCDDAGRRACLDLALGSVAHSLYTVNEARDANADDSSVSVQT